MYSDSDTIVKQITRIYACTELVTKQVIDLNTIVMKNTLLPLPLPPDMRNDLPDIDIQTNRMA